MNGIEIIRKLLELGHIIKIKEGDYVISNSVIRGNKECIRLPKQEEPKQNIDDVLKNFLSDCKIPFRSTGPTGNKYIVTSITEYVKKYFSKLLVEKQYSYEDIVAATKRYYHESDTCRLTITNYFKSGLFEQIMEEYLKKKQFIDNSGTSENNGGRVSL